jgi:hypothetical protein
MNAVLDGDQWLWYNPGEQQPGLAAPVKALLRELDTSQETRP